MKETVDLNFPFFNIFYFGTSSIVSVGLGIFFKLGSSLEVPTKRF